MFVINEVRKYSEELRGGFTLRRTSNPDLLCKAIASWYFHNRRYERGQFPSQEDALACEVVDEPLAARHGSRPFQPKAERPVRDSAAGACQRTFSAPVACSAVRGGSPAGSAGRCSPGFSRMRPMSPQDRRSPIGSPRPLSPPHRRSPILRRDLSSSDSDSDSDSDAVHRRPRSAISTLSSRVSPVVSERGPGSTSPDGLTHFPKGVRSALLAERRSGSSSSSSSDDDLCPCPYSRPASPVTTQRERSPIARPTPSSFVVRRRSTSPILTPHHRRHSLQPISSPTFLHNLSHRRPSLQPSCSELNVANSQRRSESAPAEQTRMLANDNGSLSVLAGSSHSGAPDSPSPKAEQASPLQLVEDPDTASVTAWMQGPGCGASSSREVDIILPSDSHDAPSDDGSKVASCPDVGESQETLTDDAQSSDSDFNLFETSPTLDWGSKERAKAAPSPNCESSESQAAPCQAQQGTAGTAKRGDDFWLGLIARISEGVALHPPGLMHSDLKGTRIRRRVLL